MAASLLSLLLLALTGVVAQSLQLTEREAPTQATEELVELGLQIHETTLDCSHFVNSPFETIGLSYDYQPSRASTLAPARSRVSISLRLAI